jgi:splicing factor 3B subunit 2
MAAAEVEPAPNPVPTSDLPNGSSTQDRKKSRESDRRRRRRKQKKNKAASNAEDAQPDEEGSAKDNADPKPQVRCTLMEPFFLGCRCSFFRTPTLTTWCLVSPQVEVEVEYVPEKPELDDALLADFKDIFDKFTFKDSTADTEVPPYPALTIF